MLEISNEAIIINSLNFLLDIMKKNIARHERIMISTTLETIMEVINSIAVTIAKIKKFAGKPKR
jgi:hypothetical protein